jgi:hypothetical protein
MPKGFKEGNLMNCPKCKNPVAVCGEVTLDDRVLSVYQCEACVVDWEFDGQKFPAALTFAIDADGNALDPETGRPLPSLSEPSAN